MERFSQILLKELEEFETRFSKEKRGIVTDVGDGIARISGLSEVAYNETLRFENGILGVAQNLEEDSIGAIVLGDYKKIKAGDKVEGLGKVLEVPVGRELLGRVINPLGEPLDGRGEITCKETSVLEKIAPGVITREAVKEPLETGIIAIDAMIPIGKGQRELIIGDRQTGKTALAIDTIINQKDKNMVCIYVAIGQKKSKVAKIKAKLEEMGAMEHTVIVSATASDPAALLYLAPYAGCAIGEYFRDRGEDALVVYDDLSKHAWAYREISLLLRRPPGREAYPGDIFYLHSRLLERAAKLNKDYGGGSLTALPIIETQAGDISAYIPTNVISITDGQIYLEPELFYQGIRPAINVGLSVSRVGGSAQRKTMKQVAGKLRLELAQYRELAAFAQFGSEVDEATKKQLERGKRLTEVLKQPQFSPMPQEEQIAILFVLTSGLWDEMRVEKISKAKEKLLKILKTENPKLLKTLVEKTEITEKEAAILKKLALEILEEYKN